MNMRMEELGMVEEQAFVRLGGLEDAGATTIIQLTTTESSLAQT